MLSGAVRAFALPLVLLAVLLAARLLLAGTTGIVLDEAYYWTWSRHLAAGYFDHPPGIAWVIAASDAVFGATSLGVRAAAVALGIAAIAVLLPHARDRLLFLGLCAATPLAALGGLVATPDAPLCFGWAVALAGALRGDRAGWLLAGLGAGVAGLGKYTGWGVWPLLLLGAPREWRRMLPGFALTLLLIAPNLAWNATHDWVSLRFQVHHGLGGGVGATSATAPGVGGAVAFLGAQLGLIGPVLFGAMVAWWTRGWRGDRTARLCWWTSLPPVVFFSLAAMFARGEANWAAPAYAGALVGLARAASDGHMRIARTAAVGVWMGVALVGLLVVHVYHPLVVIPNDPTARLGEGEGLAQSVEAWGVAPVYTTRYQEAAAVSYYRGVEAYALPGVDRPDQYDLWPIRWASPALFVRPFRSGTHLNSDEFCPDRGFPGLDDGGGHVVTEPSGERWQVYVVSGCRARPDSALP